MNKVLISGKRSFKIDVPYELIETGTKGKKPLIVYLHGYKQNLAYFKKKVSSLLSLKAYHLIVQGPYPIYDENHKREVKNWGRAWYLYDGNQKQFIKSLDISSGFIQELIDEVALQIRTNRLALFGYSMGGYLAGYFALSRPAYVNDLIVIGGRIKTEHFAGNSYPALRVLALHGRHDEAVSAVREKESCEQLKAMGATVTFQWIDQCHRLTDDYIEVSKKWLISNGYK